VEGSPAAEAGLEPGDLLVAADGERLAAVEDLFTALRQRDPGETMTLSVARDGERRDVEVELADRPR
jgi:putative serine protease PepD